MGRDMAVHNSIRCDCGYRLRARAEERQVAEVRRHAWEAHGISFTTDEALGVLLRLGLEEGVPVEPAPLRDATRRRESR